MLRTQLNKISERFFLSTTTRLKTAYLGGTLKVCLDTEPVFRDAGFCNSSKKLFNNAVSI
jgi:hypothetical protein